MPRFVLVDHAPEARFREDEALVAEAVQELGRGLDDTNVGDLGRIFFYLSADSRASVQEARSPACTAIF